MVDIMAASHCSAVRRLQGYRASSTGAFSGGAKEDDHFSDDSRTR